MSITSNVMNELKALEVKIQVLNEFVKDTSIDLKLATDPMAKDYIHQKILEASTELGTNLKRAFHLFRYKSIEDDEVTLSNDLPQTLVNTTTFTQPESLNWINPTLINSHDLNPFVDPIQSVRKSITHKDPPQKNTRKSHRFSEGKIELEELKVVQKPKRKRDSISVKKVKTKPTSEKRYLVTTLAGGSDGHQDGIGSEAKFIGPIDLICGPDGNIYVTDDRYVRKVSREGVVTTILNSDDSSIGIADFSGIDCDMDGNLYVTDPDNARVIGITKNGQVCNLAGVKGVSGLCDGGTNTALFNYPTGIAVDGEGNVLISDSDNGKIRYISCTGDVSTIESDLYVTDIAINNQGVVYVLDNGKNRVSYFNLDGKLTPFAGTGKRGYKDGKVEQAMFRDPSALAIDRNNNVYIADYGNNRIRKITPDGYVTTFAGNGKLGHADGDAAHACFDGPVGIAVDKDGIVYVADSGNSAIRKIYPDDRFAVEDVQNIVPEPIEEAVAENSLVEQVPDQVVESDQMQVAKDIADSDQVNSNDSTLQEEKDHDFENIGQVIPDFGQDSFESAVLEIQEFVQESIQEHIGTQEISKEPLHRTIQESIQDIVMEVAQS